ncbi:MAG: GNAT family N-acetyltransferase, partial [Acidimicrobiales bacterium]
LKHHGLGLASLLLLRCVTSPQFGWELLRTRVVRYGRGVIRASLTRRARRSKDPDVEPAMSTLSSESALSGEVTHVMVGDPWRGRGVARELLKRTADMARRGGLAELILVTPPALADSRFYERLGWQRCGDVTSGSGESFVRYRLVLHG